MAKITLSEVQNLRNETSGLEAINDNFDIIAEEFENTLSRDGTTPNAMESNLDMSSFRIINLPSAVALTEPVRLGDLSAIVSDSIQEVIDNLPADSDLEINFIVLTPELQEFLVDPTSAKLAAAVLDETGTAGALVFSEGPTINNAILNNATLVDPVIDNEISGDLLPEVDEVQNIGSAALNWGTLFLSSTGGINWESGDITILRSAPGTLAFSGASIGGYQFDTTIFPVVAGGSNIGSGANSWGNLFITSGGSINFNNSDVTITHSADALTFQGATNGYLFSHALLPQVDDGAALGSTANKWSDLFLASGSVINFNSGDVTITHSTNALTVTGISIVFNGAGNVGVELGRVDGNSSTPFIDFHSGATAVDFDARLIASGGTGGSGGGQLGIVAGAGFVPVTTDTVALGTATLMFSDLFLASGAVVNFNNGDVTITHSANLLQFQGASGGYSFDAIVYPQNNDGAALGGTGNQWSDLFLATGGVINWNNGNVTIHNNAANQITVTASSGTLFTATIAPSANDGGALGGTALQWSDLFLAEGGVINWDNGDATLTQSGDTVTLAGADLSIGTTAVFTAGSIELGNASDTTLSRSAAGRLAVESINAVLTSSTDTLTNKRHQPRLSSAASGDVSPDVSVADIYIRTGLTAGIAINSPGGTPVNGEKLIFRFKDDGTARALTFNAIFRAIGVTIPTTTVLSKITYVGAIYNSDDTKWDVIAVTTEA